MRYNEMLILFLKFSQAETCVVAATVVVKVVDKGPFSSVLEDNANETYSSREEGVLFFYDFTVSPCRIVSMLYNVAYFEIQSWPHDLPTECSTHK